MLVFRRYTYVFQVSDNRIYGRSEGNDIQPREATTLKNKRSSRSMYARFERLAFSGNPARWISLFDEEETYWGSPNILPFLVVFGCFWASKSSLPRQPENSAEATFTPKSPKMHNLISIFPYIETNDEKSGLA